MIRGLINTKCAVLIEKIQNKKFPISILENENPLNNREYLYYTFLSKQRNSVSICIQLWLLKDISFFQIVNQMSFWFFWNNVFFDSYSASFLQRWMLVKSLDWKENKQIFTTLFPFLCPFKFWNLMGL